MSLQQIIAYGLLAFFVAVTGIYLVWDAHTDRKQPPLTDYFESQKENHDR